jgi:hypothetical protein
MRDIIATAVCRKEDSWNSNSYIMRYGRCDAMRCVGSGRVGIVVLRVESDHWVGTGWNVLVISVARVVLYM